MIVIPRQKHMKICAAKVNKRLAKAEKSADFMSCIIGKETEKLSNLELVIMASAFIIAGSSTTSSALSGTTFFPLRTPGVYKDLLMRFVQSLQETKTPRRRPQVSFPTCELVLRRDFACFLPAPLPFLGLCLSKKSTLTESLFKER
jgi:cytochrome P450